MLFGRSPLFGGGGKAGPDGYRAFAIGDVHGRLDLLDAMLAMIEADIAARPPSKNILVFLGDIIDRGPDSAQVIERLRTYRADHCECIFLMGNHEEVMLRVIDGEEALLSDWLEFGGSECVASYGIDPAELRRIEPGRALDRLKQAVPEEHVDFVRAFADTLSFGSYLFVHAGIRPGVPLADQAQQDLRWIRQPFLEDSTDHEMIVVHGHTITRQIDDRGNRIGLDTGAYRTGILTAMGIEGAQQWFLQTGSDMGTGTDADRVSWSSASPAMAGGG